MKNFNKILFSMASLFMMSLTSCVNEPMGTVETDFPSADGIATIQEQIESVESSVKDLESLQAALQQQEVEFDGIIESLENHIAALQAGAPQKEGSIATFELQKSLAAEIGAIQAELNDDADNKRLSNLFNALEEGVSSWLGNQFDAYFPLAVSEAKVSGLAEGYESLLNDQKNFVDGVASDLKAGLKEGVAAEAITSLSASVQESIKEINDLNTKVASVAAEVEDGYRKAIATAFSSQSGLDKDALENLNETAVAMTKSVDNSLANLNSRIAACEAEIVNIQGRLDNLEEKVEDLKELLSMIQSVTYLADYSGDKIFAYYELNDQAERDDEGRMKRTPTGDIVVDYLVRPASAATALADNTNNLWGNGLKVIGYYADQIQLAAVDPSNYINFTIKKVTVKNAESGVISVTVNNDLKDAFYMKETGAKFALSIQADKTDITSKFVELAPKDNSGKVYLESLTLSDQALTVREMATATLKANINPAGAYDKTLTWTADNENITINQNGQITGNAVGNSVVTVTTTGTDEWGRTLSATCNVTVISPVKLSGPAYVETSKEVDMSLDYPANMDVYSKRWWTSDNTKATVSDKGVVTGVGHTYNSGKNDYETVTVYCMVNNSITVSHDIKVVVTQPLSIKLNKYGDNVSDISIRIDESLDLGATIYPDVPADQFRLFYQSTAGLGWIDPATGITNVNQNVAGAVYVYIDVLNYDQNHYFAPGRSLRRTVVVRINPYLVTSIKLNDVEMQPGNTVTLSPTFTTDVDGKVPTNTNVTWTSNNEAVATVDQNGKVTSIAEGSAIITATATDGSNVTGSCTVTVASPWKEFNVGDYVVRTSSGEIEFSADPNTAKSMGTIVGIVITKTNPRVTDTMLPTSCTHGIAIALGEGEGTWSSNDSEKVSVWAAQSGKTFVSDVNVYSGYTNTQTLNAFITTKGGESGIIDAVNSYNNSNNTPKLPNGTSSYYLPSASAMKDIANLSGGQITFSNKLTGVGGTGFTNSVSGNTIYYWTVSETASTPTQAVAIRAITDQSTNKSKTSSSKVRFVFAF